MTHHTRHAAGSREPRGGAWRTRPIGLEHPPRSPDGGGWVEAWEPANVKRSRRLLCGSRYLYLEERSPVAETWAAKTRNTRRREPQRCELQCLLPEPEVPRPELLGKPKARNPWPGRRPPYPPAPGSPESSKVCPGPVSRLTPSVLAPCPAEGSQSRADGIRSSTYELASCRWSEWPCRLV